MKVVSQSVAQYGARWSTSSRSRYGASMTAGSPIESLPDAGVVFVVSMVVHARASNLRSQTVQGTRQGMVNNCKHAIAETLAQVLIEHCYLLTCLASGSELTVPQGISQLELLGHCRE
jgi:hypothetical protein